MRPWYRRRHDAQCLAQPLQRIGRVRKRRAVAQRPGSEGYRVRYVRNAAGRRDTMGRSPGQPVRDAADAGQSQPTEDHAEQPRYDRRDGPG